MQRRSQAHSPGDAGGQPEVWILGKTLISFKNVTLGYGRRVVLEGLNFDIEEMDFLGVIGPNGSGKTTLLRGITGRLKPLEGSITIARKLKIGYVIQRQFLDSIFPLSVEEVVRMGRYAHTGVGGRLTREDQRIVDECLEIVGLGHLADMPFRSLSGGQKQRILIARALAFEPEVMLLDEPTNDLDIAGENRIMDLIHEVHHEKGITVIMVSHLLHVVLNHVEKLLFIQDRSAALHSMDRVTKDDFISKLYGSRVRVGEVDGKKVIISE